MPSFRDVALGCHGTAGLAFCCSNSFSVRLGRWSCFIFVAHYAAPLTATIFALLVQAMRHLRRWKIKGRPVGIFLTRLVVLLVLARVAVLYRAAAAHARGVEPGLAPTLSRNWMPRRVRIW